MTGRRLVRGTREAALTGGAILGCVCLAATVAGYAFGITPLVFRSGSMSPAIHTGDLAVARTVDARSLDVGDIVSVINADGHRVTHRLRDMSAEGDARQLTLQGDANQAPDAEVYTVTRAERVLFDVPKAGYVVSAASGPGGLFVLGAYVTGMLVLAFRRRPPDDPVAPTKRGGARKAGRRTRVAARSAVVAVTGATLAVAAPASAAFWTDPAPVTGTSLTAYTLPAPATFTCGGLGVLSVTFNWAAVTGATDYTLHYGPGGATTKTVTGTSTSITSAISGGTAWIVANRGFTSTTWSSVASTTRSYTVAVVSLCS
ncbi:signal peptidase I [Aeromicrobium ginsengisoli]|uniref:Signal peptidase I n=1 Tax=Aeromicrobium ginsengisoli TaxID=363867 RepID=A0A5M4FGX1_9ACTN|nr:signal peptidase I [Aeromicrobium ginsengisoli]KAA1399232.1 signal peptidase I [Aeromicrobium ginsengisoli]